MRSDIDAAATGLREVLKAIASSAAPETRDMGSHHDTKPRHNSQGVAWKSSAYSLAIGSYLQNK